MPTSIAISDLIRQGFQEIGKYYLYVLFVLVFNYLASRFKRWQYIVLGITSILIFLYFLAISTRLEIAISVLLSLTLTFQLYLTKIPQFNLSEYPYIFFIFLIPQRLFNSSVSLFGVSIIFSTIIIVLPILIYLQGEPIKKHLLEIFFAYTYLSITVYLFQLVNKFGPFRLLRENLYLYRYFPLLLDLLTFIIIILATVLINRRGRQGLHQLKYLGLQYPQVNRWSYSTALVTTLIFIMLNLGSVIFTHRIDNSVTIIIPITCLVVLGLEILFIALLLDVLFYRRRLTETQKLMTDESDEDLQRSLADLREIRHDLKNTFYTMGNYVERSQDEELKNYFWQTVYQFAENELAKSTVIQELYKIPVIPLRSLLQVKGSQCIDHQVDFQVTVQFQDYFLGMDLIDLTRILGILLDNAREESQLLPYGKVQFSIKGNCQQISYIVKNNLLPTFEYDNIQQRRSTKNGHQGMGLKIIDGLISRYNNVTLNTYVLDGNFIQALNVEK